VIVTRTPFRITLGGGGTDLPSYYRRFGGFVVSAAIDKYMSIVVNTPVVDELIRVNYSKSETVETPCQIQHSIAREALRLRGISGAIQIVSLADAPAGCGVGSSSAYAVGLLNALHALGQDPVSRQQLAEEACHIEIDVLGKPIGKQDQYIAAFGGIRILNIDTGGRVEVSSLDLSQEVLEQLEESILIFYTGISRDGLEILAHQDARTSQEDPAVLDSLHDIKALGIDICNALQAGDCRRFGELTHEHWMRKKSLSKAVTSSRIDEWYELARRRGAIGGKITGAGGGGFLTLYAEGPKKELREALRHAGLREVRARFDFEGTKVLVNQLSNDQAREHLRRIKQPPLAAAARR
jgi:D-glycero-alpha-D-manno-heptose-7-phosphate kinase